MPFGLWISSKELEEMIRSGDPRSVAHALSRSARWQGSAGTCIQDNPRKGECVDLLIPLLVNGNDKIRANVSDALWFISMDTPKNLSALKPVAARLKDPSPIVRLNAARVLANWSDSTTSDALLASLSDPDDMVRGACAEGLAKLRDPRALAKIEQSILAGQKWNEGLVEPLERLFPPDRLVKLYISMLSNNSILTGLRGICRMAEDPMRRGLTTPAIKPLIAMLGPWPHRDWVSPADILALMRNDEVAQALLDRLSNEQDTGVRAILLNIISQLKVPHNARLLQSQSEILSDKRLDRKLRVTAAERLIESGRKETAETLALMLQDLKLRDWASRDESRHIGELIGVCALSSLLEPLLNLAADPFTWPGSLCALGGYTDPRAIRALLGVIDKYPGEDAERAAISLARIYERRDIRTDMKSLIEANGQMVVWKLRVQSGTSIDYSEPTNEIEARNYSPLAIETPEYELHTYHLGDYLPGGRFSKR